jgi:hypothetical protein
MPLRVPRLSARETVTPDGQSGRLDLAAARELALDRLDALA